MRECERFKTAAQLFAEEKSDDERYFIVRMFMMHILLLMNALPYSLSHFASSTPRHSRSYFVIVAAMDPENMTLKDAIEATSDFFIRQLPQHIKIGPTPLGSVTPMTLPIREVDPGVKQMKHFSDIIYDHEGPVNHDQLHPIMRDKAWHELLEPFKLKKKLQVDYTMQLFVLPQQNGKSCIVKHMHITNEKIKASTIHEYVYGTAYEIIWGSHDNRQARKGLQWMLEQMGGVQYRFFALTPMVKKTAKAVVEKSEEELDKGFEFTRIHGERDRGDLTQLAWIQKAISQDTPIKGWKDSLVQRCLDSLATDSTTAKLITRYDLTVADFEEPIQEILQVIVPSLRDHALWILGEPGKGKTPLGRVVAMMFSRYHGGPGAYRSASDFDYFRGCPFTKKTPAIYDDGDIGPEPIKKQKAFSDVADQETLTRERWTAAKFHQNQLRIVIDNSYDPKEETTIDVGPNPSITRPLPMTCSWSSFVRRWVSYFNHNI